jgi:hypothetical protein
LPNSATLLKRYCPMEIVAAILVINEDWLVGRGGWLLSAMLKYWREIEWLKTQRSQILQEIYVSQWAVKNVKFWLFLKQGRWMGEQIQASEESPASLKCPDTNSMERNSRFKYLQIFNDCPKGCFRHVRSSAGVECGMFAFGVRGLSQLAFRLLPLSSRTTSASATHGLYPINKPTF